MNKKKNGFTLVELLAVIVVLGLISAIASGIIINTLGNAKSDINKVQENMLIDTAKLYYQDNYGESGYDTAKSICIQYDLVDGGYLENFTNDKGQKYYGTISITTSSNKQTFKLNSYSTSTTNESSTKCWTTSEGDGK